MLTGRTIKVAIIDDDEDDYFIITDYIRGIKKDQFVVDWLNNYDEAVQKIKMGLYDLYFVDYRLGYHTGLELLQEASVKKLDIPIVLLTGKGNKDIDIKAMQSGATDYLIKSELNTEKLERCIRYSLDRTAYLRELKTRENKYRALFENSKDAVFIGNEYLEIKEANTAAAVLFGTSIEELANCNLYSFIRNEAKRDKVKELFVKRENVRDLDIEIVTLKGEVKPCLLSLSFMVMDSDGDKKVAHAVLHDITAIKRAELANLHAQKLASNERLMRTLAHEIRNPLNNIGLSLDQFLMPEENEDEDEKERHQNLVDIMQRNCVRINQIITELLDLTRPLEMAFKKYSLQHLLDESINYAADRINLQKITLHRNFPNNPLVIAANESKLVVAFTNIMINAIEAMEKGKGELTVSLAESPDGHVVTISDNGMGIPEEYLPKLFEPFFTLKKNGMGLGLATSYTILQSHKAKVHVESKLNQGSSFIISFQKAD